MIRMRVDLGIGWAEAKQGPRCQVRVGDQILPKAIDVVFHSVDGQPELRMTFGVVDGRPQCRKLVVESPAEGREVMQLDLRAVRLAEWVEEIFAMFALQVVDEHRGSGIVAEGPAPRVQSATAIHRARAGRGNRKIDDALLGEVAEVYRANPKAPLQAVADEFGVSRRQASNYRKMAADAGFLPATTKGKKAF